MRFHNTHLFMCVTDKTIQIRTPNTLNTVWDTDQGLRDPAETRLPYSSYNYLTTACLRNFFTKSNIETISNCLMVEGKLKVGHFA